MKPYSERYLEHYGVKGMKWGRRQDGAPQGTLGWRWSKGNRQQRSDQKRAAKLKKATADLKTKKSTLAKERAALRPKAVRLKNPGSAKTKAELKEIYAYNHKVRAKEIDRARARIASKSAKLDKKQIKAQYKVDRLKGEKFAGKMKKRAAMSELYRDQDLAAQVRDGKEFARILAVDLLKTRAYSV